MRVGLLVWGLYGSKAILSLYSFSSLSMRDFQRAVTLEAVLDLPEYSGRRLSRITTEEKMLLQVLEKSNSMVSKIRSRISPDSWFYMNRRDSVEL